jgi:YHS domain-containing protein
MPEVLLDIILLLVLSGALRKFLGGVRAGMQPRTRTDRPRPSPPGTVHMERDPVCGTFVVPDRAVALSLGRERIYFCSQACRDRYRAKTA